MLTLPENGLSLPEKTIGLPWPPGFFYPGCPCCGDITDCSECSGGVPSVWTLPLSGVTNSICSDCDGYNKTHRLIHTNLCVWTTDDVAPCGFGFVPTAQFQHNAALSIWQVTFFRRDGNTIAGYSLAEASFDCLGDNVLSGGETAGTCTTWPSTVTVSPV